MKLKITVGSFEIHANGKRVVQASVDHEEVDGWRGEARGADGEWTRWRRRDGAYVGLVGPDLWRGYLPDPRGEGEVFRDAMSRPRGFSLPARARQCIDRYHPLRGLAHGGPRAS